MARHTSIYVNTYTRAYPSTRRRKEKRCKHGRLGMNGAVAGGTRLEHSPEDARLHSCMTCPGRGSSNNFPSPISVLKARPADILRLPDARRNAPKQCRTRDATRCAGPCIGRDSEARNAPHKGPFMCVCVCADSRFGLHIDGLELFGKLRHSRTLRSCFDCCFHFVAFRLLHGPQTCCARETSDRQCI